MEAILIVFLRMGKYASHRFSNYYTKSSEELITLPDHNVVDHKHNVYDAVTAADKVKAILNFLKSKQRKEHRRQWPDKLPSHLTLMRLKNIELCFMFILNQLLKGYAIYGVGLNRLYQGDMSADGYIYIWLDGRTKCCSKRSGASRFIGKSVSCILKIKRLLLKKF
ncbi:MAG: hypothetical protein QM734_05020 [Cyclobacteriaceae bacterium]